MGMGKGAPGGRQAGLCGGGGSPARNLKRGGLLVPTVGTEEPRRSLPAPFMFSGRAVVGSLPFL